MDMQWMMGNIHKNSSLWSCCGNHSLPSISIGVAHNRIKGRRGKSNVVQCSIELLCSKMLVSLDGHETYSYDYQGGLGVAGHDNRKSRAPMLRNKIKASVIDSYYWRALNIKEQNNTHDLHHVEDWRVWCHIIERITLRSRSWSRSDAAFWNSFSLPLFCLSQTKTQLSSEFPCALSERFCTKIFPLPDSTVYNSFIMVHLPEPKLSRIYCVAEWVERTKIAH